MKENRVFHFLKKRKADFILISVFLLAGLFLLVFLKEREIDTQQVVVKVDGEILETFSLNEVPCANWKSKPLCSKII